jgi:hypothetical protein
LICRASNTSIALQNEENMVDRQKHDRPAPGALPVIRHCERSEAIQNSGKPGSSSLRSSQ